MVQVRIFSFHDLDTSQSHNTHLANLVAPGVYRGYRIRRNASDPSLLDITHGADGESVLVTRQGVRIQELDEILGDLKVQNADPVYSRYDLVVSEYVWTSNTEIEMTYKVIRGRYPDNLTDPPPLPQPENENQIPLAFIFVRPQIAIAGQSTVVIEQSDILHIAKAANIPAQEIGSLKPIIDPTNSLRVYIHPGTFPTLDGLSFVTFEGGYSDIIDDSLLTDGETRYYLFGVSDAGDVSVAGESSELTTIPNIDADVLLTCVLKVVKRGGQGIGEDLIDIRFPFTRTTVPRQEADFYQDELANSVFRYARLDDFRDDSFIDLSTLAPDETGLTAAIDKGETSLKVTWAGSGEPSGDVTIATEDLLLGSDLTQIRHILVAADTDITGLTFDYSAQSGFGGFTEKDRELNKIQGLADGVSQLFIRFKIPASQFEGGATKRIFSFVVFMVLDYETLNENSISGLGLENAVYSTPNLISNGDFKVWSRAPSSGDTYPDINSRDKIIYPIRVGDFASRKNIFAGDGWQFTRLDFAAEDDNITRILWSRDVVGSNEENTMDTALEWVGESGAAGSLNYLEHRVLAPQGYDGQYVTFAVDFKSQPREAVGIRLVFYERGSEGTLVIQEAVESGPLRTEGTLILTSGSTLNNKVFAIGFIIVFQQTTGVSTVYVRNARAAIGRYSVLPFTKHPDADDINRKYYERGQIFGSGFMEEGEEAGASIQFGMRKLIGLSENNEIQGAEAEVLSGSRLVNAADLRITATENGLLARAKAASTGLVVVDTDWEAAVIFPPVT
jgi:hypothetical protein